jgi:hypothetical protein
VPTADQQTMRPRTGLRSDAAERAVVLGLPLVLVLGAGLALLGRFDSFSFKDEIAYLVPAERYADGDLLAGVNGYWGPLTSWLLVVPLLAGIPAALAARLVSLALAAVVVVGTERVAATFRLRPALRLVVLLALVPWSVYFAIRFLSADLTLVAVLVVYFAVLFDPRYATRRWSGPCCGLLGALAYFTKGYGLPFFLGHFTIATVVHALAADDGAGRRRVVRHYLAGLAVLGVLALAWIGALYAKYDALTTGSTGTYNYAIVGPDARDRPILEVGFVEPPPAAKVSIWEDPHDFYDVPAAMECCLKGWSPLDSDRAMRHQLDLVKENGRKMLGVFGAFSPLFIPVVVVATAVALVPLVRRVPSRRLLGRLFGDDDSVPRFLALATLGTYPALYLLVYTDERYLWPTVVIVLVLAAHVTAVLLRRWPRLAVPATAMVALAFAPLPLRALDAPDDLRRATESMAAQVERADLPDLRFASNVDYGAAMIIGHAAGGRYYGQAVEDAPHDEILASLRALDVPYYFVFDEPATDREGMEVVDEYAAGRRSLVVYRVTPAAAAASRA